jgi:AcrR family transcriptional regulator
MAATPVAHVPRRSQIERTAESDARMLEAAIALIIERGADRTTLKDVGERAGYSRGLAGYRFGSKAGLLAFVVRSVGDAWLRALTRATHGRCGLEALEAATDAHLRFCLEAPDHVRAFYALWFEAIGPGSEVRDIIAGVHDRRRRDVETWIRDGIAAGALAADVDARAVADAFCASITGIVYQWLIRPAAVNDIRRMHRDLEGIMRRLLDGGAGAALRASPA